MSAGWVAGVVGVVIVVVAACTMQIPGNFHWVLTSTFAGGPAKAFAIVRDPKFLRLQPFVYVLHYLIRWPCFFEIVNSCVLDICLASLSCGLIMNKLYDTDKIDNNTETRLTFCDVFFVNLEDLKRGWLNFFAQCQSWPCRQDCYISPALERLIILTRLFS